MLRIHFLNVGKGSCTIIEHSSSNISMIDIDNLKSQDKDVINPIEYFQSKFKDRGIFRFILTHPDLDHMSGLDDIVENKITVLNFWDTDNNKTIPEDSWKDCPYNKSDWDRYLQFRKNSENPKCLQLYRDATGDYYTADGISVLSPTTGLVKISNDAPETDPDRYHHLSYVLMVEYQKKRFLLGGDASPDVWDDIVKAKGSDILRADVFFAPHHGSKNNINEEAFKAIKPDYVVVSVAEGIEYDREYYSKLASKEVLSTKYYGNIIFTVKDDGSFDTIRVSKNA